MEIEEKCLEDYHQDGWSVLDEEKKGKTNIAEKVDKELIEKNLLKKKTLSDYKQEGYKNGVSAYPEEDVKGFIKNIFQDCEKNLVANKIKYSTLVQIIKNRAGGELYE